MIESKFYNKKRNHNSVSNNNLKNIIRTFITKCLITIIITLVLLIIFKVDRDFKSSFNKYVYNTSLPFTDFKDLYDSFFKGTTTTNQENNSIDVFTEKLSYSNASLYKDGVKLTVSNNYLVPALESGIVVFIGEKDDYGKTVIVQQMNGIDVFYGNISSNVNIYDYVEKGSLIGESIDDKLYLVFQKEGKNVNYKEYLK